MPASISGLPRAIDPQYENEPDFIVGIGASAGGLEAIERLLKATPDETGMAFVIVQHLSPDFKSLMEELLGRHTRMAIHRVESPLRVEKNSVYLIPPRRDLILNGNILELRERPAEQQLSMPINVFFRSLARAAGPKAAAVILSGTGTDGTLGIVDIHEAGGLVLAQSLDSAKFDGMPRSAIDSGLVDIVAPPEDMPKILLSNRKYQVLGQFRAESDGPTSGVKPLRMLLDKLRSLYGIDFGHYKPATIERRMERRVQRFQCSGLDDYCTQALDNNEELEGLCKDMLIGVTQFFRDPSIWDYVKSEVILPMIANIGQQGELRAWVPGCATGEEAYTLAILIAESLEETGRDIPVRIFATDVHSDSLQTAAEGLYAEASIAEIPRERADRYFTPTMGGFRIHPNIRKMLTFSRHNLLKDPPFTRLDLVSCRNLLIYFQQVAQVRALAAIHFGLKVGSTLVLGPSETPGDLSAEFESLNRGMRIYRKIRDTRVPLDMQIKSPTWPAQQTRRAAAVSARISVAYDALLSRYVPPGVLVNDLREVVHYFGDVERFLRHPSGPVTNDVVSMARGDLRVALAAAIQNALRKAERSVFRGVRIHDPRTGTDRLLNLAVDPIADKNSSTSFLFVGFEEEREVPRLEFSAAEFRADEEALVRISQLEQELQQARESLQTTVEELETSNEELQATNEELLAANEELQSTNEELHSVNEELYTVNAEHELKIRELVEATNDLNNLVHSTEIATIFLDSELRIRLFTPAATDLYKLLPYDTGRDIRDIRSRIQNDDTLDAIAKVQAHGGVIRTNVMGEDGKTYLRRLFPYADETSRSKGVVLTFVDISELVSTERRLRLSEFTLENSTVATFWMDSRFRLVRVNRTAISITGYSEEQLLKMHFRDLIRNIEGQVERHSDQPGVNVRSEVYVQRCDGTLLPAELAETTFQFEGTPYYLAFAHDISDRKRAQEIVRQREDLYYSIFNMADAGLVHLGLDGEIITANQRFSRMLGYDQVELAGKPFVELLHPDGRAGELASMERLAAGEPQMGGLECRFLRKDGTLVWGQLQGTRVEGTHGAEPFVLRMVIDASARKHLERAMSDSIQEKETLLKEVHHRVKNNLQLICSILSLHSVRAADSQASGVFSDIARRVQAMALIHEKLYRSSNFSNVDFADYATGLTTMLTQTYAATPGAVKAEIEAESVAIGVDEAIPLALILNELVSNCLKHGFPEGREGVVRVKIAATDGTLNISVTDNGTGLPAGLNWTSSNSLGLSIVNVLVRQLHGQLRAENDGGACFHISIPYRP